MFARAIGGETEGVGEAQGSLAEGAIYAAWGGAMERARREKKPRRKAGVGVLELFQGQITGVPGSQEQARERKEGRPMLDPDLTVD